MNISRILLTVTLSLAVASAVHAARPGAPGDGQLYLEEGKWLAWSEARTNWLPVERFWLDFAENGRGQFRGRGADYPPYDSVNEHDSFLVELEQGPCLMYFFHSRWRRAQDVWRWDERFNQILGCPRVFD